LSISTIDTHAMVKQLIAVGFTDQQAEAVTSAVRQANDIDLSSLSTKADLAELRAETKADLAELRAATKADIAELRAATMADIAELRAATTADIAELRAATKADIAELRAATKADIAELRREAAETKVDIVKWVVGIGFAQAGFVVAMIKLMH